MPDHEHDHDDVAELPWADGFDAARLAPTRLLEPSIDERAGEITGAYPHGWASRESSEVAESWRRQFAVIEVGGTTVRIQARLEEDGYGGVQGDQGGTDVWPLTGDLLIAGSVRGPATYLTDEQFRSRDVILHQALTFLVRVRRGALLDRGHEWSEPALIATGLRSDEVVDGSWQERFLGVCHGLGIDTVVRVRDGQWQVLTLPAGSGSEVRVVSSDPCSITRDVEHRCPMQPAPDTGQYCHMRGGPWTSKSIHAAAAWTHHRRQIVIAVGCDTCDGTRYLLQGQVVEGGGPISLVDNPVPNRWLAPIEEPISRR